MSECHFVWRWPHGSAFSGGVLSARMSIRVACATRIDLFSRGFVGRASFRRAQATRNSVCRVGCVVRVSFCVAQATRNDLFSSGFVGRASFRIAQATRNILFRGGCVARTPFRVAQAAQNDLFLQGLCWSRTPPSRLPPQPASSLGQVAKGGWRSADRVHRVRACPSLVTSLCH